MKSRDPLRLSIICLALAAGLVVAGCSKKKDTTPPVATPSLTLSHDRAPAGSPLELTYKFVVPNDARFAEDYRVFVHVVDTDEEQMWTDDHNPPVPTSQWKPGRRSSTRARFSSRSFPMWAMRPFRWGCTRRRIRSG